MIKGIIFDLDGVILSTDEFHYNAWKKLSDEEGIYFDKEINNRLRGVSRMASLEIILEKANKTYTQEEKNAMAERKNSYYVASLESLNETFVSNEVLETLYKLKDMGLKLAIGSSSKNTKLILQKIGLIDLFDAISDGTMITNSKPDPEVFLKARDLLNLDSSEAYVVEDAFAGIDAGNRGNFKTIGIGDASKYDKATFHITSFKEILDILKENNKKPVIQLKHIKKVYPNGKVEAIKDFSLDIYDGEFIVFVGPSGCGKSTVLRMIAGLEEITDGDLIIDDNYMNDEPPTKRNISMVFQNYALYPHLSVRDNIAFPLAIKRIPLKHFFDFKYRKERKEKIYKTVDDIASKINLTEYLDRKPKNLSGGQRQRVALGRAMVRNPKAFLLDEPLSNLDAKMRSQMRTEISSLHNELKTIFIYVTHDQIEAMTMGTRIVVLKDGVIQQVATPQELFLHPVNKFVAGFIGTPQMNFFNVKLIKQNDEFFVEFKNNFKLSLPLNIANKIDAKYIDKEVVLGIRPKCIVPQESRKYEEQGLTVNIKLSEQLGDEALIYFEMEGIKGEYISSSETYTHFKVGSKIKMSMNLEQANIFDLENGNNICL